jgi:hypothetical protein
MIVTMKNSKGQIRKVEARRKVSVGTEYIYRLKQFAEEKFSATSLSSTNIKGLNTKSKAKRVGRYTGKTKTYKKAIVTLRDGNSIEL